MSWYGNTYYDDDGSTLSVANDGGVTATPAMAADMIQGATGSDGTDFFGVLNGFTNLATQAGRTITTLQAQADAYSGLRAAAELARARQDAALTIGKSSAEIATINAQRDVAIAKANAAVPTLGSSSTLLLLALAGGAFMFASKK